MYNFVALVSKSRHIRSHPEALSLLNHLGKDSATWELLNDSDHLAVYAQSSADPAMRSYVLPQHKGVVFGRLFRSGSIAKTVNPGDLCGAESLRCRGRRLLTEYWGAYVAILDSPDEKAVLVVRDCSGRLPCYYLEISGLYVFFSDIRDVGAIGVRFTINTLYLAAFILHHPLHVRETGLQQVSELLAGDCASVTARGLSHECFWNPLELAKTSSIDEYDRAKLDLTRITEHVIQCWAQLYDGMLLSLSGGLDSAIVLGCLKRLGAADRVVCVNEYTVDDTRDDERHYARAAAEMANVRLIELPRICDATLFVEMLRNAPAEPDPYVTTGFRMLSADRFNTLAAQFNLESVWTGQGGDHVFLQARDTHQTADYLLQHLIPYRLPSILYDAALLSGQSIWFILHHAMRSCWHNSSEAPLPFDSSGAAFIDESFVTEIPEDYARPEWRVATARMPPPGKLTQIDTFSDLLNRHKPLFGQFPYECHPLISQPLLELSLRTPTYHLLRGGRQRAMARDAFADRVPLSILNREDKGGIMEQSRALLRGGAAILRDHLLHGTLVSLGIVNRQALERFIVSQDTYKPTEMYSLAGCIAAEMWAAHWGPEQSGARTQSRRDIPTISTATA